MVIIAFPVAQHSMTSYPKLRLTIPSGIRRDPVDPELRFVFAPTAYSSLFGWKPAVAYLYIAMAFVLTLGVAAAVSRGRIFWEDELLGWLMLRDPSWRHMIAGWLKGVDGGGILFYLTGRLWFLIFGASVLSFRLYTATGFALTFSLIWAAGRRFYGAGIIAFAILITWFGSPIPIQTLAQGRFYGLVMAANALATYLYVRLADKAVVLRRFYVYLFLAHACLVTSHILGVVYSSLIVLAMIVQDFVVKNWRPWLYLSAVIPDLLLIPCLPAIYASARVGKPHFWSTQPTFLQFVEDYSGFSIKLMAFIAFASVLIALASKKAAIRGALASAARRRPIYIYCAAVFMLPLLFLLEGFAGPALCVPRYLLPVSVGTIFLIAELATLLRPLIPECLRDDTAGGVGLICMFLAALIIYDTFYIPHYNDGLQKDYTGPLTSQLPQSIPVVCEDAFAFTELIGMQHDSRVEYTFLLDWKNATSPHAPRVEVTQYHLMQNWQQHGYFSGSIHDRDLFLRNTPLFYTVSFVDYIQPIPFRRAQPVERYPAIGNPLHQELAHTAGYRVNLYKVISLGDLTAKVWRICQSGTESCQ